MFKKTSIIFAFLFLAGCAAKKPIDADIKQDLKTSNIAVAFYMNSKDIYYSELVYKVLWAQREAQDAAFGTLWDIDRDMSKRIASIFANQNMMASPVQDVLKSDSDYANFQKTLNANPAVFDPSRKPFVLDEQTCVAFKKANIRYLVLERSSHFVMEVNMLAGNLAGVSPVRGSLTSIFAVYDVNEKKQVFESTHSFATLQPVNVKAPKEVEANGLKILKETTYQWLDKSQNFYLNSLDLKDISQNF